jgi:hypothetical protein
MQYLRARYYDQNTGRFASTDPFEGWQEQPVSRHRYVYGNDNPVMYSDPSGYSATTMTEVGALLAVIETLGTLVTAQAIASSAAIRLGGQIDWTGVITGADISVAAGIRGNILHARALERTRVLNSLGASRYFAGKWLQVAVGIDFGDVLGGLPGNPLLNESVTIVSPRWLGAQPGALAGGTLFGTSTSGTGTGTGFIVGYGFGVFNNTSSETDGGASISAYIGLSIPIYGTESPDNILP